MNWFLIAVIPPLLDSISVYIDKYLLEKHFQGGSSGALLIFSSLIGIIVFPLLYIFHPQVTNIHPYHALVIILNGMLNGLLLIPYFYALNKDETSTVVPLFQTIPIFSYIMAFFILGEQLTSMQIYASLLVIIGAVFLSLDLSNKMPKLKKEILGLMLLSSFFYALSSIVFKFIAIKGDFWATIFWEYVGLGILGFILIYFVRPYRKQFFALLSTNRTSILSINLFNEGIYVVSMLLFRYVSLLAPLALIWTISGLQPFFVLVFGILITLFIPKITKEKLSKGVIWQKVVAIYAMGVGIYIINSVE